MSWDAVVEHGLITTGIHLAARLRRIRFLKCRLVQPNLDMRIAFSALLRISKGGRYVLVRNLHRPEVFGPFGGVYKYFEQGRSELDALLFKPQDFGPDEDMKDDLRGFIPRKRLPKLVKWYQTSDLRESSGVCLYRELSEELKEAGLDSTLKPPAMLSLRRVRAVEEGPEQVPGERYTQYRVFEVYEPLMRDNLVGTFIDNVFAAAVKNPSILVADADEILVGRTKGDHLIGHHAAYLLSGKRIRTDDPPFAHRTSIGG